MIDLTDHPTRTLKLQKVLANEGYGSRRKIEEWISEGRVSVNGEIARVSMRVSDSDAIAVDGKALTRSKTQPPRMLIMNKVAGQVVSTKPQADQRSVFDELPKLKHRRWIAVGRLDVATSGLLLFTDNGDLAHKLMHPSTGIDREYAVRIKALLNDDMIEKLKRGVNIDGHTHRFSDIRLYNGSGTNNWYHIVLMEGRNREIRKLFAHQNILVSRIKRVRYGPFVLPSWMIAGKTVEVTQKEVRSVCEMLELQYIGWNTSESKLRKGERSVLIAYPGLDHIERV